MYLGQDDKDPRSKLLNDATQHGERGGGDRGEILNRGDIHFVDLEGRNANMGV
jgi:hypothetical protein